MSRPRRLWIGRLGLQLTVAFAGVALAGVIAALLILSLTIGNDFERLIREQNKDLTQAVAAAAASAYGQVGWAHANLAPVVTLAGGFGGGIEIRDRAGTVVRASLGFALIAQHGPKVTAAIVVGGRRVGSATIAFGRGEIQQQIGTFRHQRWQARVVGALLAVLIALVVALPLSRLITAPVEKLIWTARARSQGDSAARVGSVRGFGKLNELALAFDEMAQTKEEQDQLRRNLVADVAHELRTPIAVLQAGHEAMMDGLTAPNANHLASLRDEVLRLARMVDDLQRLASAEAAALQLTLIRRDLAVVAATAVASLVDTFEAAGVTLVQRLTKVEVMCDPLRMHEIIVNLLTNAMKFTPPGGQVTLETHESEETGQLKVSDTGIGIPADELPHVAERFYRGQRSVDVAGSGIGLTIVTELVRAHFGWLGIESEQGRGTTVTVTLPLAESGLTGAQRLSPRPGRPSDTRRRHVSIIAKTDEHR